MKKYQNKCFLSSSLTEITNLEGVTSIRLGAFADTPQLKIADFSKSMLVHTETAFSSYHRDRKGIAIPYYYDDEGIYENQ